MCEVTPMEDTKVNFSNVIVIDVLLYSGPVEPVVVYNIYNMF